MTLVHCHRHIGLNVRELANRKFVLAVVRSSTHHWRDHRQVFGLDHRGNVL